MKQNKSYSVPLKKKNYNSNHYLTFSISTLSCPYIHINKDIIPTP